MSAVQLSFSLRVSSGVKTVHLLGSWDGYIGQLPLSKDKSSSKSGSWKGTFRFQNSTLEAGQRYWYYYIIDGYHVAHNPSVTSTIEPTTGRELNVLDVPTDSHKSSSHRSSSSKSSSKSSSSSSKSSSKSSSHKSSSSSKSSSHSKDKESRSSRSSRHSSKLSVDIPKGRPLSISQIQAPKPMSPHATKHILDASYYDNEELEELADRFGNANIEDEFITDFSTSPVSSSGSSLSYRSDSSSPNSSLSGYSTPGSDVSSCTCERYGITRKGERVKLDCGGSRCGYDDDSDSICSSGSEDEYEYEASISRTGSRRHGVVA
ncbi:GTP-binding protein [Fusarium beomiforme]|uniref:GTP-binding protein n=1 Tax=Fusarium beomiforme TaxID=44412 RepID=A0A9P5AUV2_9HYPO|nr:GTP-binding protein [Fusarium beomiforme]